MSLPHLARSFGGASPNLTPGTLFASTVATTATSADADVYVSVDAFGAAYQIGPCSGWQPRYDGASVVYPTAGDEAVVQAADDGSVWIVGWKPV